MSEDHEIEEKVKDFSSDKIKFNHCEKKFYFFEEFNDAQNTRTYRTDKYMLGFYRKDIVHLVMKSVGSDTQFFHLLKLDVKYVMTNL